MAAKLALYNSALLVLGERKLASLAEAREPRRALDDAYDDAVAYCLEAGFWNFSMRAIQADSSASVTPTFGYTYAFTKPSDFVRLYSYGSTETFDPPLLTVVDEPNYWYANVDPIYVKYVSNDTAYGMDLSLWSESFSEYVSLRLAVKTCKRITGAFPNDDLKKDEKRALAIARSKDAMDEPVGFPPRGTWATSRLGGRDRNTGNTR
ncbi:hypothetical protein IVB27_32445 [Bradyrhizobium sp. 197]|uniref:hypothetical protein n=1 Tax=Bradyrhizobium sp. 197 TaxID=2782663 RepID=UPI001FF97A17|nr:hypothetical protein [Bradyrhizobium sp. 197]MCK1479325.1 hypothetical protein [Bradyrhizobium sp. 197]